MSRKTLAAFVVLALLGISLLAWSAPAPSTKTKEETSRIEEICKHPVLVLTGDSGHLLEEPRVRSIGGRSFVIGKAAKTSQYTKESFAGKVIWIPFEKVKEMIELPAE